MDLSVVANLVTNITQLLANEVNFLQGTDGDVRLLNVDLKQMETFLKDSEGKRKNHQSVMDLVAQIREAAYEAEDIVDEYVFNVAKQNRKGKVAKFFGIFNKAKRLHKVREKIKDLNVVIEKIYKEKDTYGIEEGEGNIDGDVETRILRVQQMRQEVEENDVVGFADVEAELVNQLIKGTNDLDVISISGMGGLGKTTIAKKVYKDGFVRDRFRCHAWVSVSQKFNEKELLQGIVKGVTKYEADELEKMNVEELKKELTKQLSDVRYLIVLDDIWTTNHWDRIKVLLPKNQMGSRIFITTRHAEVARHTSGKDPFKLRFLRPEESWELFTKKVFRGRSCPNDLISPAKDILKICGGLPLAIVVSAGILAKKPQDPSVWADMAATMPVHLEQDATCKEILSLSYEVLPSYLQPCFLYFGLFPEDHKIPATQLIQLWIAEGFIKHEDMENITKERVAKTYLQDLIDRSLVQLEERSSNGGVKNCRVHDLIRDLCRDLSGPDRFLAYHTRIQSERFKPRRLSIHCSRQNYVLEADSSMTCQVRSLLCFKEDSKKFAEEHWDGLFKRFKLLRVLDLGEGDVHRVPGKVEKLILLKYLKIKTNKVAGVPPSICTLYNLQTLDLRRTRISNLPEGIWKMQQLRHLYLDGPSGLPKKNDTNRCLTNLQTLCYILQDLTGQVKIKEMAPNLRKLGLYRYKSSSDDEDSIFSLPYLENLKFASRCIFDESIELPKSIKKISMKATNLPPKTVKVFQSLSTLQILKLDEVTFNDNVLVFEEGSFQRLQVFKIENSNLVGWKLKAGAAPNLKRVVISKCLGLKMIPEQLWERSELQKLELLWLRETITKEIDRTKNSKVEVVIYPSIAGSQA